MSELFDQDVELLPPRTVMSINFGGSGSDIFIIFGDGETSAGVAGSESDGEIHDNLGRVRHFEVTPYALDPSA